MFELKNKSFYNRTLRLMLPVAIQQLITVGINFLDNIMIGGFGETQIAAASFGNQYYFLFQFISMGLGSGAIVLSAQFWGRKELEPMKKAAAIAMRLSLVLSVVFTLFSVLFPQLIMRMFTGEAAVVAAGTPYMRLIGLTFLLSGLASTATYLLRSVGQIRIPLIGSAVAFVVNLFFNWVFIFGKLGAPRMEIVGAAVGTVIARVVECVIVFGYFVTKEECFGFRLRHFFLSGEGLWRVYFKYGIPVLISDTLLGLSLTLTGVIQGQMGETMASASAIVNSFVQLLNVFNMSIAGAASIVVGNTIGQGDILRAKREGNTYMLLAFLFGLVMAVPLLLTEGPYMSLYNVAQETRTLVHGMLLINCLTLALQTNAYVSSKGILRGGGDTRFLLVADSGCIWLISLPLGALGAFVWGLEPLWVYLLLYVQHPLKGIICFIRYATGKWIKVITTKKEQAA